MATWVKSQFGLGYWLRGQTEHVLLGVKGNPRSKMIGPNGATGKAWSTAIYTPRGEHSEKPIEVMIGIEKMFPTQKKIELFARKKMKGWSAWGLDVIENKNSSFQIKLNLY